MDNPSVWAIVWIVAAAGFGIGELVAGSFFLLPFAVGALVASIVSALGAPILVGWLLFIGITVGTFIALKPVAQRLDSSLPNPTGIGANRLIGGQGLVTTGISPGSATNGLIQIESEEWPAESRNGVAIPAGTHVQIVEVRGTRVVVEPSTDTWWNEAPR